MNEVYYTDRVKRMANLPATVSLRIRKQVLKINIQKNIIKFHSQHLKKKFKY